MANVKVKINGEDYKLKFGYGVIRRVAMANKISGYNAFGEYVNSLGFGQSEETTFEQLNFIGQLVRSAVANELGEEPTFSVDDVVDSLTKNAKDLEKIMEEFVTSMPTAEDVKKGNLEPSKKRGKGTPKK